MFDIICTCTLFDACDQPLLIQQPTSIIIIQFKPRMFFFDTFFSNILPTNPIRSFGIPKYNLMFQIPAQCYKLCNNIAYTTYATYVYTITCVNSCHLFNPTSIVVMQFKPRTSSSETFSVIFCPQTLSGALRYQNTPSCFKLLIQYRKQHGAKLTVKTRQIPRSYEHQT